MKKLILVPLSFAAVPILVVALGLIMFAALILPAKPCTAAAQTLLPQGEQATNLNTSMVGDGGAKIPKKAVPWIKTLATKGKYHYPEWYVAADMMQESSFNPKNFTDDSNDGTRGLVQINQEEWNRVYKSSNWDEDRDNNGTADIMDPLIHSEYAAKLWDEQVDTIKRYKKENPNSRAAKTSDAVLLLVSHNAGPRRVTSYPNIPDSTRDTYIPKITNYAKLYGGDLTKLNFSTYNGGGNGAGAEVVAQAGGETAKKNYKLPKVKAHVKTMADYLGAKYGIKTVGGWRSSSAEKYDQAGHPSGLALDYMTNDIKDGKAAGDKLANDAQAHAKEYGVRYIIWQQKIWNVERERDGWRKMSDRGSPTQNHMDHVHISFQDKAGTKPPAGPATVQNVNAQAQTQPQANGQCQAAAAQKKAAQPSGDFPKGKREPSAWGGYQNGKIDRSKLKPIPWASGQALRSDATDQFIKLNERYKKKFGKDISVTDSYRDYPSQVRTKETKGNLAATPGTSKHGWALAVDLGGGINNFATTEHEWMKQNAPKFGWIHPDWAEPSGALPEPWHWEYWGVN